MKDLMSVLDNLNLSKINNQPIDLKSPIGERGSKLSGGQVQRVEYYDSFNLERIQVS